VTIVVRVVVVPRGEVVCGYDGRLKLPISPNDYLGYDHASPAPGPGTSLTTPLTPSKIGR